MDQMRSQRRDPPPDREKDARAERRYLRYVVTLVVIVLTLQVALRFDAPRRYLNRAIRLEGLPLERRVGGLDVPASPWLDQIRPGEETGAIYLRLVHPPEDEVWVLVNEKAVKMLDREGGVVTVQHDDLVEVLCDSEEVRAVVSTVSPNVESPEIGVYAAGSGRVTVGRVRLR